MEQPASAKKLFDDVRNRLVETGTRNRLVHVNRANTRGNVLNIINERSDEVFRLLCSGKTLKFKATGKDKSEKGDDDVVLASIEEEVGEDRYTDNLLEVRLGPDALQKKLLKIQREARTAEEESGVNLLYLALGFLTWFEDPSSKIAREAPLVLVPVELVRNAKTSTFDIKIRDDEFPTNLPLQQRLKGDFGIELPDVENDEGWAPSAYFDEVRDVVSGSERWSVDNDAIQLGFFSFSKLLMYRDLDAKSWPEDALTEHDLTRGLLWEGFDTDPPLFDDRPQLDEILQPEDIFHVVDADASQATVIEEVRRGRNLVVQGPPGTGKSQTITNIIAAAVKDGKTVLFVAEKMAALSVVHDRLVKVGLRDVCLELHSRGANKKAVLAELAQTLNNGRAVPALPGSPNDLKAARDQLNQLSKELHQPIGSSGESGYSVLGIQSRFLGRGAPPPILDGQPFTTWDRTTCDAMLETARLYAQSVAEGDDRNPFDGCANLDLQPVDLSRLAPQLSDASAKLEALDDVVQEFAQQLGVDIRPSLASIASIADTIDRLSGLPIGAEGLALSLMSVEDTARLSDDLAAAAVWKEARVGTSDAFVDHAYEVSAAPLRGPMIEGSQSFFARWGSSYRGASRELAGLLRQALPKRADDRLQLVDSLLEVEAKKRDWAEDKEFITRALGDDWRGDQTNFDRAKDVLSWLLRLRQGGIAVDERLAIKAASDPAGTAALGRQVREKAQAASTSADAVAAALAFEPLEGVTPGIAHMDLEALAGRFSAMAAQTDRYADWSRIALLRRQLEQAGLQSISRRIDDGGLDAQSAPVEIEFARVEALWKQALEQSDALRSLGQTKRHELVDAFAELERARLKDSVKAILAGHLGQLPQGALGEMRVIRGEIGKRRAHMALRKLFRTAGTAIQRIKPVLLMSPISVAQFLPPGTLQFDILLIDEASQVRPEDALGAIARAKQIVVVGDKKQLPPTSFFDRLMGEDDESEGVTEEEDLLEGAARLGSLESVLTLCEARGLGSRMLSWHYRSRDPSLIKVSNREFYGDGLVLPPSPNQRDPAYGMHFHQVAGVYDRGGKRDNRVEGEAVVAVVAKHAREYPELSLGIVTFSFAQRNLITELLEFARRSDPQLDAFLQEGKSEDVFVKNIENVQGDERDVILVTVGYGPATPGGKLSSMTFGPVNSEGGERRLNVLFTRARVRCDIFASFDPGDIDVSRTKGEGPRVLKRFLDFAKSGDLHDTAITGEAAETAFEQDVAEVIRSLGFLADPQVGSAGFRIDLGVRHPDRPGKYLLAVECDGATYHSALWARERDRLRQEILEGLGWRFHRIWSTDWFYRRAQEVERLRQVLEAARSAEGVTRPLGSNRKKKPVSPVVETAPALSVVEIEARVMPAYERARPAGRWGEPHEAMLTTLQAIAEEIIRFEGPISSEEVARRVASAFGKEKAGSRIVTRVSQALRGLRGRGDIEQDGNFWFTSAQRSNPPVRDRSLESGATLKAANISAVEAKAALRLAQDDNAGGSPEELVRAAARLLGFKRVGSDLGAMLMANLDGSD